MYPFTVVYACDVVGCVQREEIQVMSTVSMERIRLLIGNYFEGFYAFQFSQCEDKFDGLVFVYVNEFSPVPENHI